MACFHPLSGYRTPEGSVTFDRSLGYSDLRVTVSCGQCSGCRLERSRQWAVRIMHEAQQHEANCFITLTYDEANLPHGLVLDDWQLFAKRLRKRLGPFRFYHCGEYGERTQRPHYHAAIFGQDFSADRKRSATRSGHTIYNSPALDELWGKGFAPIGSLTFESAAYVARYIMKKITGKKADDHYQGRRPEYTTMSRRPGIGKAWYDRFKTDLYPSDQCVINGIPTRPPAYYDYQFELENPAALAALKAKRVASARRHRTNNTPERLRVRETVAQAKLEQLKRDAF